MCGESPQEVPLCGTGRHGFAVQNVPHIFFLSCQKKSRRHSGGKGNRLGMSWPPMGQLTQNGGLAVTNCRPNPEVSYRLRR